MTPSEIRVSAVVFRDPHRRVLCVRKRGTSAFMFPGGKPEPGETPREAAIREVLEELGIMLIDDLLNPLGTFTAPAANEEGHTVVADVFSYPAPVVPEVAAEIAEHTWVDLYDDDTALAPLLKDVVFPALKKSPVRSAAVFTGACQGGSPKFTRLARDWGVSLAHSGIALVYGGGQAGLIGEVASAALRAGGTAVGVIPRELVRGEGAYSELTRIEVVATMHERKQRMSELADAFICLPGGTGTLDELFDVWCAQQIGSHAKPIALVGRSYWQPLLETLHHMVGEGFIRQRDVDALLVVDSFEELACSFKSWRPPAPRWG